MKETYSRPTVTNADTTNPEGLLPVVEAATKGYALGKAARKIFGADIYSSAGDSLVKRKKFTD